MTQPLSEQARLVLRTMTRPASSPANPLRVRVLHELRLLAEEHVALQEPGLVALDDHVALGRLERALLGISGRAERAAQATGGLRRAVTPGACGLCAGSGVGPDGKACGYCCGSGRER